MLDGKVFVPRPGMPHLDLIKKVSIEQCCVLLLDRS